MADALPLCHNHCPRVSFFTSVWNVALQCDQLLRVKKMPNTIYAHRLIRISAKKCPTIHKSKKTKVPKGLQKCPNSVWSPHLVTLSYVGCDWRDEIQDLWKWQKVRNQMLIEHREAQKNLTSLSRKQKKKRQNKIRLGSSTNQIKLEIFFLKKREKPIFRFAFIWIDVNQSLGEKSRVFWLKRLLKFSKKYKQQGS